MLIDVLRGEIVPDPEAAPLSPFLFTLRRFALATA
jgi:hypothetical protein